MLQTLSTQSGAVLRYQSEGDVGGKIVFHLQGELDSFSVKELRETIDGLLSQTHPAKVIFDLAEVAFSDSAGLGLILGRYSKVRSYGGEICLQNVNRDFMKILKMAGADKLLTIESAS